MDSVSRRPLAGRTALVTGASRGAGRGVARALGEAGATVYVTARSRRGASTAPEIGGTIDDVADEVSERGGTGIAIQADHTDDEQTASVFDRIERDRGQLDVLVNSVWGGNELELNDDPFWQQPMGHWDGMFSAGVRATIACSRLAAPIMIAQRRGLICHVSFWDRDRYTANLFYDAAKVTINRLALAMASELRGSDVAVLAVSPGFMRTERVLAAHEGPPDRSESPEYLGRAISALAGDPKILERSGTVVCAGNLAREYGFTDVDGSQPPPFEI